MLPGSMNLNFSFVIQMVRSEFSVNIMNPQHGSIPTLATVFWLVVVLALCVLLAYFGTFITFVDYVHPLPRTGYSSFKDE